MLLKSPDPTPELIGRHERKEIAMARNFFNGTDAELNAGTQNFSTKIGLAPATYGLSASQATSYASVSSAFTTAYTTAITPATRTRARWRQRIRQKFC